MTIWLSVIIGVATAIVLVLFGVLLGIVLADKDIVNSKELSDSYNKAKDKAKKKLEGPKPAKISKIDNNRVKRLREKKLKQIPDFLIDKNGKVQ